MYEYCFLACFCASQRVHRLRDELTLIRQKLPNGWTDWHQIWHTCADSSGNGYTPNKLPLETQGGHLGGFRGSKIQKSWEAVKRLDRLAPTLVHVCAFHLRMDLEAKYNSPLNTPGAFQVFLRGSKIQKSGSCQTAGPIGTKFGTRLRIRLGMDIG